MVSGLGRSRRLGERGFRGIDGALGVLVGEAKVEGRFEAILAEDDLR